METDHSLANRHRQLKYPIAFGEYVGNYYYVGYTNLQIVKSNEIF